MVNPISEEIQFKENYRIYLYRIFLKSQDNKLKRRMLTLLFETYKTDLVAILVKPQNRNESDLLEGLDKVTHLMALLEKLNKYAAATLSSNLPGILHFGNVGKLMKLKKELGELVEDAEKCKLFEVLDLSAAQMASSPAAALAVVAVSSNAEMKSTALYSEQLDDDLEGSRSILSATKGVPLQLINISPPPSAAQLKAPDSGSQASLPRLTN